MHARTLGRWIGLAAGVLGLGGWLIALSVAIDTSSTSARTVTFFVMMLLAIAGVAVGAYKYNEGGLTTWRSLLVVAALLLSFGTILSGFTVGLFFLPAAVAALAASAVAFLGHHAIHSV
jgi:hypothetical protein